MLPTESCVRNVPTKIVYPCSVAILVPAELDLDVLHPESERRVVQQLLIGLDDEWYVVPKVPVLIDGHNAEIDVVLVSPHLGVLLLEVKGGQVSVREGVWYGYKKPMKKSPFEQVALAKHKLIERLKEVRVNMDGFFMSEVVVLPDVGDIPTEGLGPGAPRNRTWSKYDLLGVQHLIGELHREKPPVGKRQVLKFLQALCPTVELTEVGGRFHAGMINRIDAATRLHLDNLVGLADNQQFLVTGGAGTGKTYLAEKWARRCAARGEKTLFLSYNVPLAEDIAVRLEDTDIVVGSYHRFLLNLLEPYGLKVPSAMPSDWWENGPAAALVEHVASVTDRFDAMVFDEGQDFRDHWLRALQLLFRVDGPKRLLMVADPLQALYAKGWTLPAGMPKLELSTNLRSSRAIGSHVADLGGARPNSAAPVGPAVRQTIASEANVAKVLAEEILRLQSASDIPASQIAVLARHRKLRDALIASAQPVPLVRWEQRDEGKVLCETIHRVKGLERPAIIMVDLNEEPDAMTNYIGASRAMLHLVKIVAKA
jgi:hypothetical protein